MWYPPQSFYVYFFTAIPIFFLLWQITAQTVTSRLPTLRNKRIVLLIAHPDDEAMFFAPTLLALTRGDLGNHVKVLCLSSGDADGQGEIRKKEFLDSVVRLGLRSSADAFLVDDPTRFPDSMKKTWSKDDIADVLSSAFAPQTVTQPPPTDPSSTPNASQKGKSKSSKTGTPKRPTATDDEPPRCTIDVMITFDAHGVSAHPNHKSLFHGAKTFLGRIMKGKSGYACPLDLYTLHSTSVARKYISGFDTPITMVAGAIAAARNNMVGKNKGANAWGKGPLRLLYVNGVSDYRRGAGAMTQCHGSQMRWFRWGWVAIGRYMVVNDLRRERIPASTPDERRSEGEEVEEGGREEGKVVGRSWS